MNIILCEGEDVREQTNFRIHFSRYAGHASSIYFCEGVRVSEGSRAAAIKREECCLTKKTTSKTWETINQSTRASKVWESLELGCQINKRMEQDLVAHPLFHTLHPDARTTDLILITHENTRSRSWLHIYILATTQNEKRVSWYTIVYQPERYPE